MMKLTITPASIIEPPRPLFAGHIPADFISLDIDPATDLEACYWGLTHLLRSNQQALRREVTLFRTTVTVPEPLRLAIARTIGTVLSGERRVIGGYRPAFEGQASDFFLFKTHPNFPWHYAIVECWVRIEAPTA